MNGRTPESVPLVCAGILLGGKSSRMGSPKQLIRTGDTTFIEKIAGTMDRCADRVVLLGAGTVPVSCASRERLDDPPGLVGPIAGILAALRSAPPADWVVVGCDQPLFSREAFEWLAGHRSGGVTAVLPRTPDGRVQPLGAIYGPGAVEQLEEIVLAGVMAPRRLQGRDGVVSPAVPRELARCWRSFDTRDDLIGL